MTVESRAVDAWARRVLTYEGEAAYRQLLEELTANRAAARDLLERLASFRDPIVRAWAGSAAVAVLGRDAIPLVARLLKDRDADVRAIAQEDLVGLDPDFEHTFLPDYRRALKRRKAPWGGDRKAMFALARARDADAVPLLRQYASHYEPPYWHNRMPLVLADYIEDPTSVSRRIRDHDHAFMFWLVDASAILGIDDAEKAKAEALRQPIDEGCAEILRGRIDPRHVTSGVAD
jgi:hypothetical protein